ncbi:Asp-tRNA(Asn)/Glu-tRNA(Gln) amidotransferase subunit GatA [Candidatus Pacearchaeota archaeon]|nr:Asp-tRNA(Asn)/Glu-tRNA(Gln) amidotransferase subunit GatA [Candidatus Pacearchaeota archaeon]
MTLQQKVKEIKTGKLTAMQNVNNFLKEIDKKNKDLNIYLHLNSEAMKIAEEIDLKIKQKKPVGKLAGLCVAVKSCISVQGLITNCASKVLEDYVAPFDATVIKKLKDEDAIILGMVNMDEFACGGSGETSAFGPTKNPVNPELIPGGSSSGPGAVVAANMCDFSLGSDTGGSIRNPASHCGIVGLKPTYGAVSRYGLLDLCMSFDTIGPLTKTVEDSAFILSIIKGQDNFDATTKDFPEIKTKKKYTIGLVDVEKYAKPEVKKIIYEATEKLAKKNGYEVKKISLPLDISLETYYLLVYVEFFSATRKYDGRRFGKKIEEAAGHEVLRRIFGGSEISKAEFKGKYYREALKARSFIKQQFETLFKEVDLIILPTVPRTAHKIGENISVEEMYAYDIFTVPVNIAGIPGISIPIGKIDKKPIGLQILAPHFHEDWIFDVGRRIE